MLQQPNLAAAVGHRNSQLLAYTTDAAHTQHRLRTQHQCGGRAGRPALGLWKQPSLTIAAAATAEPALYSSIVTPAPVQVPRPRHGPVIGQELVELTRRFKRLQNGSDIRGIAMAGVPNEPVTLTPGAVFFIGVGLARWLAARLAADVASPAAIQVAVGRDPRMSGPYLEGALVAGLRSEGIAVTLFGPATTPCMFCCTLPEVVQQGEVQHAGVMLTASHMPWNANGLKFFTAQGGLEKADISDLLQRATQACSEQGVMVGEVAGEGAHLMHTALALQGSPASMQEALWGRRNYAAHLRQLIIRGVASKDNPLFPLLGLRIVVDAGNGAGGFFATEVLAPLGADITGSQFLDADGSFPNHIPNPEHPSAMAAGAHAVLQAGADLGIVFDTDVDRSAIVDRTGREINSNRFIALMAAVVLREHPGTTIVTDSVTSNGLAAFIAKLGGKHVRYKRGYKNVIGQGILLNNQGVETHLMMETSGHGAIKENHYLDDGAYLAVKVVIELVRRRLAGQGDVGELLAALAEPLESREFRIRITEPDFKATGAQVLAKFHDWINSGASLSKDAAALDPALATSSNSWTLDPVNHEGWRVNIDEGSGKKGWVLLRQSLHDPLLVLNVESEVEGGVRMNTLRVLDFLLHQCQAMSIDMAALKKIA